MMKYLKSNWDGWPLHSALAAVFFYLSDYDPKLTLLFLNSLYWPHREIEQHGFHGIWTLHRMLEWGCPVLVGLACYWWMS